MKTVILCGGYGSRFGDDTKLKPKPLIEIGGMPIVCHIMHIYQSFGFREFVLALGYKSECFKDFFIQYPYRRNDLRIDFSRSLIEMPNPKPLDWIVHLMDTGLGTKTGGRLARLRDLIGGETFLATYGDGVADVDIGRLLEFHRRHGKLATITGVRPKGRFGTMNCEQAEVRSYREKEPEPDQWVNGGYFVFESGVLDWIEGDDTELERGVLEKLAEQGQLMVYKHDRFWGCMDNQIDRNELERLWEDGVAPWKLWNH